MSTPRYIREYLTAHPDAHRDEVIDRLGYDFEHETVRGPVYDSWGESVMDEHNCLELREELQELLASFKTEDSKAAYEIARLGLNPQQLTEYRTSISSFVTSCLDAYEQTSSWKRSILKRKSALLVACGGNFWTATATAWLAPTSVLPRPLPTLHRTSRCAWSFPERW